MCLPLLAAIPAVLASVASSAGAAVAGLGAAAAGAGAAVGAGGLALASTAVGAVTAGVSYAAQSQQAAAQNRMAVAIGQSANSSYLAQTAAINSRMLQERDAGLQQSQDVSIRALQAQGRAKAASAEGGASGVGLDEILTDINAQQGRSNAAIQYNYKSSQVNAYNSEQNAYYSAKNQQDSVPFGVSPSLAMPILSTFGSALGAAGQYGLVRSTGASVDAGVSNQDNEG